MARGGALPPIGVVFVHGVGSQPQSSTLREFSQPLVDWLHLWHQERGIPGFRVRTAELSYGNDLEGPARLHLDLPLPRPARDSGADPQEETPVRSWVLAEAWWAARLAAPEFVRMLVWSFGALQRTIDRLRHELRIRIALLTNRELGKPGKVARSDIGLGAVTIELISTSLLLVGYTIAGFAGLLLLVILLPLAFIPLQQVRDFVLVRLVRSFLVENVGDFTTFIDDDVQALNIRRSVEETIAWLVDHEGCEKIVVIAHSQGTVVAFDALCGMDLKGDGHLAKVRKLITFGAALNRAFDLAPWCERLQGTLPKHIYWLDVWAYYDPVPGGPMERDKQLFKKALVSPPPDVRERFHWRDDGPMPRQVVNGMNVLKDHGGYWRNDEQFLARLAAEVEDPDGYYHDSRFYFRDEAMRVRRRRIRITTLVGWRLAAMALFAVSAGARLASGGFAQLERDGRAVVSFVGMIPGIQVIGLPGQVVSALGTVVHLLTEPLETNPALSLWGDALRAAVDPVYLGPLALIVVGLALLALLFTAVYLLLTHFLFDPWDERERRESVQRALPRHRPDLVRRSAAVLVPLLALAVLVARPL